MVHDLAHILSMGPYNGAVVVASEVQYGKNAGRCPTRHLRGIFRKSQASDHSIIIGLKNVLTEIHLPYPQQLILSTSHAEARTYDKTANGRIIM
jgi:hypothetical protein